MEHPQLVLDRYSFGIGDRFGQQGEAQLAALRKIHAAGVSVTPVWNKSHREHAIIGTGPGGVRREAAAAVRSAAWDHPYFVDADHIRIDNVAAFIEASDFFTLDVAEDIGRPASSESMDAFLYRAEPYLGRLSIPGIEREIDVSRERLDRIAGTYLAAVQQAAALYRHIAGRKEGFFVTEVSMDETETPQAPEALFFILLALAEEGVPLQTIAPKFSGRFNKGVDYVGDPERFGREFSEDIAVVAHAVREFGLPTSLKLSVHSGSDKFSIYPQIRRALAGSGAGVHVKTAGTTWLEELIGLASAGGEALRLARDVYASAYRRRRELCAPYATVIDIDETKLPDPGEVSAWSGERYAAAVRHIPGEEAFNPDMRQLLHVGYKVAAEMGPRYIEALRSHSAEVARHVGDNLYERHLARLFTVNQP